MIEVDTSINNADNIVLAIQAVDSSYTAEVLPVQASPFLNTDKLLNSEG
jgi:hypothetical protein